MNYKEMWDILKEELSEQANKTPDKGQDLQLKIVLNRMEAMELQAELEDIKWGK